jgi:hypothetical protein
MIRINIIWEGKRGLENLIRYIENNDLYFLAQDKTRDLAYETVLSMREMIVEGKKRHSFGNNLESNINAEDISTTGGIDIGIGNISDLKANAPYYEVLDRGGYIPYSTVKGAPLGSFEGDRPDGNVVSGNQNWERSGNKGYFMKPKSAIEGLDYIGRSLRNLDLELKVMVEELGGTWLSNLEKNSK